MKKNKKSNAYQDTNVFSKLFFCWVFPFLRARARKSGKATEFEVPPPDEAQHLGDKLERVWLSGNPKSESGRTGGRSLLSCIFAVQGTRFVCLGIADLFNECVLRVLQPILLRFLVQSFTTSTENQTPDHFRDMCLYAGGLCFTALLYSIVIHTVAFHQFRLGMRIRVALSGMVYRKALRVRLGGGDMDVEGGTSAGRIANLLSTDVARFDNAILIPYIVIGPAQLVIFTWLLWREIGYHAFSMIAFVTILLPLQYVVFRISARLRLSIGARTDARARFMGEFLNAISVIKMYGWEPAFSAIINKLRSAEIRKLRHRVNLQAGYLALYNASGKLLVLAGVASIILAGDYHSTFSADRIFFCVSIANTLLYANLFCIPSAAAQLAGIVVSMKRLQDFFQLPEYNVVSISTPGTDVSPTEPAGEIEVQTLTAAWESSSPEPTLSNISLRIGGRTPARLLMVVGGVGSGKTSLLLTLLRELIPTAGSVRLKGRLSYIPQEAWAFPGSVRDNILFGEELNEERYAKVVRSSCLEEDLRNWPHGDRTLVGQRGETLSGGQRARLNLARGLYRKADIYLLDDPMACVDGAVATAIFGNAIGPQGFLRDQTRVLVTHQLHFLPMADHIVVLRHGKVVAQGEYEIVKPHLDSLTPEGEGAGHSTTKPDIVPTKYLEPATLGVNDDDQMHDDALATQKSTGSVSFHTYINYVRALRSFPAAVALGTGFVFTQVLVTFCEVWLSRWTNRADVARSNPEEDEPDLDVRWTQLHVYAAAVGGATFLLFLLSTAFFRSCVTIGTNLHGSLFASISKAPMRFWHGVSGGTSGGSAGKLLDRFTKDMASVDELLPETLFNTGQMFLQMLGVLVVVCMSNIWLLAPTAVVLVVFYILRRFYIRTARQVKRQEAESRSALLIALNSSMLGLTIVRASGAQPRLHTQFERAQNLNSGPYFMFLATTRWFAIWLEMASVLYLTAITFSFVLLSDTALGGNVGVALTAALALNLNLQLGMRQSAEAENNMISVERILEYSNVEPEGGVEIVRLPGCQPNPDWTPTEGRIQFENVWVRYGVGDGQLHPVLCGLTFEIRGGEEIGIVGRTGAGKTSIINALFRMVDLDSGAILIDGTPITSVLLSSLRRAISIIPQDPVLFAGTLRFNLDPFGEFSDNDLWRTLGQVELKNAIPSLDYFVTDGGANFSLGQRQLLCLARAILRNSRIVVLDEATANVDPMTDAHIRATIRNQFTGCTTITIAHRLNSVLGCDRVLVLEKGTVVEYDTPEALLAKPGGVFAAMVKRTSA